MKATRLAAIVKKLIGRGQAPDKHMGLDMIEMCDSVIHEDKPAPLFDPESQKRVFHDLLSINMAKAIKADMEDKKVITHDRIMGLCISIINEARHEKEA